MELAPPAIGLAYRADVVANLAVLDAEEAGGERTTTAQAIADARTSLVAAMADVVHAEALAPSLNTWQRFVEEQERRARSGAPITAERLRGDRPIAAALAARLDAVLKPTVPPTAVMARAAEAWMILRAAELRSVAELAPTLLLCTAGVLDRVRLLPFATVAAPAADDARQAWREGELDAASDPLLSASAAAVRGERLALRQLLDAIRADEDVLAPLGRAAITARLALGVIRQTLATTMPALSEWLGVSRPAAADALERLVARGRAVEITGRARDRVYVDALAWRHVAGAEAPPRVT